METEMHVTQRDLAQVSQYTLTRNIIALVAERVMPPNATGGHL